MSDKTDNKKENEFISWPIKWPLWVSVIYIFFILLILYPKFTELKDLKANEIGDVLAGTFAPLAFFWLFYTSISQKIQLQIQSSELTLMKLEYKQSREVAIQSQIDLNESANQNRRQAETLLETFVLQKNQEKLILFKQIIISLASLLNDSCNHEIYYKKENNEVIVYDLIPLVRNFNYIITEENFDIYFIKLSKDINSYKSQLQINLSSGNYFKNQNSSDHFIKSFEIISKIMRELKSDKIPLIEARWQIFDFDNVLNCLDFMLMMIRSLKNE